MQNLLAELNSALFSYLMMPILLAMGVGLSFYFAFVQLQAPLWLLHKGALKRFKAMLSAREHPRTVGGSCEQANGEQNTLKTHKISNFESFVITTGARVGMGNIVGIALAVQTGGAGAVVWMVIAAFFGAATAFCECTLAQIFTNFRAEFGDKIGEKTTGKTEGKTSEKSSDKSGEKTASKTTDTPTPTPASSAHAAAGGVVAYIRYGLRSNALAKAFIICLVLADCFGFNPLLAHSLNAELVGKFGLSPLAGAALILALCALIFTHGVAFCRLLVPAMLCGYLGCAIYVSAAEFGEFFSIVSGALSEAFSLRAGLGGLLGGAVMVGVKQGLFSNEAGLGSAPNAAGAAVCAHPCAQGLVQMSAVAIDLAICCASAFVCLAFLRAAPGEFSSAQMLINSAFEHFFGPAGGWLFYAFVAAFCLSSFYGNFYYSSRALYGQMPTPWGFKALALAACFGGSLLSAQIAWDLASTLMCGMALINLYAIFRLRGFAKAALVDFKTRLLE